jgi:hypothetical protein
MCGLTTHFTIFVSIKIIMESTDAARMDLRKNEEAKT